MIQIETVFGYGFPVARAMAKEVEDKADPYYLHHMCHTCGQSPYFFGLKLHTINSRKQYIQFDLNDIVVNDLNGCMTKSLIEEYEKTFGRKPTQNPTFMMYTDLKAV